MKLYGYISIGPDVRPAWFHSAETARRFAAALGCFHAKLEEREDYAVDAEDICDLPYGPESAPQMWNRQPAAHA